MAAGALDALAKLAADPPAGARVRPLAVAGAFHTHYMAPAAQALAQYADRMPVRDPAPDPAVQRRRLGRRAPATS